jgi:hypothetical protein
MPDATPACGCDDRDGPTARVSGLPATGAVPPSEQPAQGLA